MANDELEEINGIKPKVWLPDGEEREVSSQSRYIIHRLSGHLTRYVDFLHSKFRYKVKRTFDHTIGERPKIYMFFFPIQVT